MYLPEKIKSVEISAVKQKKYDAILANWLLTYAHIKEIPKTVKGLAELIDLMAMESRREGGGRSHMMMRIYKRYRAIRNELEYEKVMAYAGN